MVLQCVSCHRPECLSGRFLPGHFPYVPYVPEPPTLDHNLLFSPVINANPTLPESQAQSTLASWRASSFATHLPASDTPSQTYYEYSLPPQDCLPLQYNMSSPSLPDDYEQQRKAAESFQPELTGPDVSEKLPTTALVEQYATAHPAYQAKTKNLVASYPDFRKVKGDRKCGWRAIMFLYLEALALLQKPERIELEETRWKHFSNSISVIGDGYQGLYEDMLDPLLELFTTMRTFLGTDEAIPRLEAFFNSDVAQNVIYLPRLVASAYIRSHSSDFEFALEVPVASYCSEVIELPDLEIEEPGLRALSDALLTPAGIALEVLNLHDNPGDKVDVIHYPAPANPAYGGPFTPDDPATVRLLFTPGHYDAIYKKRTSHDIEARMLYQFPQPDPHLLARPAENFAFGLTKHEEMSRTNSMLPTPQHSPTYVLAQQFPRTRDHNCCCSCHQASAPRRVWGWPDDDDDDAESDYEPPVTADLHNSPANRWHRLNPEFKPKVYRPRDFEDGGCLSKRL